jgi:hypothetical protein
MKSLFLALTFCLAVQLSAQKPAFADIPVKTAEDCKKAEPKVTEATMYILSQPIDSKEAALKQANAFVVMWMTNTADYSFEISEPMIKLTNNEPQLLAVLMAALAQKALENPELVKKDKTKYQAGAFDLLASYIGKKGNHVKLNKDLKNLLAAQKNGKLEDLAAGK